MPPTRRGTQVNVLKKVRTSQGWRLCPVVREANGRLRNRVRVGGRIEVHVEGVYYIEWREEGRRLRAAIPNVAEVLERARLKSLELEARQAHVVLDVLRPEVRTQSLTPMPGAEHYAKATPECALSSNAERLLLSGIEAFVQERVEAVLRSRLATASPVEVESGSRHARAHN